MVRWFKQNVKEEDSAKRRDSKLNWKTQRRLRRFLFPAMKKKQWWKKVHGHTFDMAINRQLIKKGRELKIEWDKHAVGVTKDLADISEQISKQFKQLPWQVADIAQIASLWYGYKHYLRDRKGSEILSELKIELADLQDYNMTNNLKIKRVSEKSRTANLTTFIISEINVLGIDLNLKRNRYWMCSLGLLS